MAEKYVSVSELRKLLGIPSDGQCTGCQFSTFHGCKDDSIQRACEAIDDAPEADVVKVVRCKDCRFFFTGYDEKCCINHGGVVMTDENGFCHHAERRDDDGK